MNFKYWFWGVFALIIYSVIGLFTEYEFTPSPFWLIFGVPQPGWGSGLSTAFQTIVLLFVLIPLGFWLRSKSKGDLKIFSRKNLMLIIGIGALLILLVGGYFYWQELLEEQQSQIQYQKTIKP